MSNIALFGSQQIRREWVEAEEKWFFSVQDVVAVLTGSTDIKQYVKRLKSRDPELHANWGTICTLVEMTAADGKRRKLQAADTPGILRLVRSRPSRSSAGCNQNSRLPSGWLSLPPAKTIFAGLCLAKSRS